MKRHIFILASLLGQSLLGQSGQGQIFRVEPLNSKVYTVTYRGADELAAKADVFETMKKLDAIFESRSHGDG